MQPSRRRHDKGKNGNDHLHRLGPGRRRPDLAVRALPGWPKHPINTQAMDVETQNVMLTGRYNEAVTAQQAEAAKRRPSRRCRRAPNCPRCSTRS